MAFGEQAVGQQRAELVQHPTEIGPALGFRFALPKQIGQLFARDGLALRRQIGQESQRLARPKAAHRLAISLDVQRPQKTQTKSGRHVFSRVQELPKSPLLL